MTRAFNLEERTTEFGRCVIRRCKTLPPNSINDRLIGQVVGSACSIGANYREANSKKSLEVQPLIKEAEEIKNIMSSKIMKVEKTTNTD